MLEAISVFVEDPAAAPPAPRFQACVAAPAGGPGLGIDAEGKVLWKNVSRACADLRAVDNGRVAVVRRSSGGPVRLWRSGRSLELQPGTPVVVLDRDEVEVGPRRLRLYLQGAAGAPHAPQPAAAPPARAPAGAKPPAKKEAPDPDFQDIPIGPAPDASRPRAKDPAEKTAPVPPRAAPAPPAPVASGTGFKAEDFDDLDQALGKLGPGAEPKPAAPVAPAEPAAASGPAVDGMDLSSFDVDLEPAPRLGGADEEAAAGRDDTPVALPGSAPPAEAARAATETAWPSESQEDAAAWPSSASRPPAREPAAPAATPPPEEPAWPEPARAPAAAPAAEAKKPGPEAEPAWPEPQTLAPPAPETAPPPAPEAPAAKEPEPPAAAEAQLAAAPEPAWPEPSPAATRAEDPIPLPAPARVEEPIAPPAAAAPPAPPAPAEAAAAPAWREIDVGAVVPAPADSLRRTIARATEVTALTRTPSSPVRLFIAADGLKVLVDGRPASADGALERPGGTLDTAGDANELHVHGLYQARPDAVVLWLRTDVEAEVRAGSTLLGRAGGRAPPLEVVVGPLLRTLVLRAADGAECRLHAGALLPGGAGA